MADQDDGIIDQSDIDKLLEASSADMEVNAAEEEIGELSQDDIDALMDGGGSGNTSSNASPEEEEDYEYELDLISQDDINTIVNKKKEQATDKIEIEEAAAEVEPVIESTPEIQEEPEESIASEISIVPEDGVIDESEAVSVEGCLVTQENIDQLIKEDQDNPIPEDNLEPEEEIFEQDIEPIPAQSPLPLEEPQPETEPVPAEDIQLEQEVEQEEIITEQEVAMEEEKTEDVLEDSAPDATVVDLGEDDGLQEELENIENDELQGDIDSLLDNTDDDADGDDWQQDSLISQDDIEDLIKSSENEDEDALGDLDSDDADEDNFDEEVIEEYEEEEEEEDSKVILEESEESSEEETTGEPEKKKKEKKKRSIKLGKKSVIIMASAFFLVIILSLAGFLLLKQDNKSIPVQRKIVTESVLIEEPVVKSVDINIDKSSKPQVSRPMPDDSIIEPLIMKGFIILAPETIEGLSYIEADIIIDYSNDSAYYEIKDNMPLYRDIIYSAVQKALGSTKGDKITEPDLLVIVQKALQRAMPEGAIKKVSFKSFKAG